ncbi:hypothetical protein BGX34_007632, partial [Mortierella sp. NVP85]
WRLLAEGNLDTSTIGNLDTSTIDYSESDNEGAIENEDAETHCPRPHRQFMPSLENTTGVVRVLESHNSDPEDEQDAGDEQQERTLKPSTSAQNA